MLRLRLYILVRNTTGMMSCPSQCNTSGWIMLIYFMPIIFIFVFISLYTIKTVKFILISLTPVQHDGAHSSLLYSLICNLVLQQWETWLSLSTCYLLIFFNSSIDIKFFFEIANTYPCEKQICQLDSFLV